MSALVFDTETTGKAEFKSPYTDNRQPHIVQIGAQLLDAQFKVRHEINFVIKPDGWTVPDEAAAIHGITHADAVACGIPLVDAMRAFSALARSADTLVAHNLSFDSLVICAAMHRLGFVGDRWIKASHVEFCTMKATTPLCKLPGNYGDFKWPRLEEAYRYCFAKEMVGAHDAMADVRACAEIFTWLQTAKKQ